MSGDPGTAADRLKRRWRERPAEMQATLDKANAQGGKRMRTRWASDPEGMREMAIRNAAIGTAKLTGSKFTEARRSRHSESQRGKKMGGQLAATPDHLFAAEYALCDPSGTVHRGRNLIDFVRERSEWFEPDDIEWKRGHCRATKGLSKLRPTNGAVRRTWKGWTWA